MFRRLTTSGAISLVIGLTCGILAAGCSTGSTSGTASSAVPIAPSALPVSGSTAGLPLTINPLRSSHGLQLTAVVGSGSGIVNVTPNARDDEFTINTEDNIDVHDVSPGTLLYVRAAADVGLSGGQQSDGMCQRADAGLFGPVALYPGGPAATIETSPGGAGSVHIVDHRNNPLLPPGGSMDLMFRLVDALPPAIPTIDLRTDCFTLLVK